MNVYPDTENEGFETSYIDFMRMRRRWVLYANEPTCDPLFFKEFRSDPIFAIQSCFNIQNPKDFLEKNIKRIPFRMYKYQANFIRHLHKCYQEKKDCIVKKSRETGFSWLVSAYGVWRWLSFKEENIIFVSLKKDALYKKNNPSTLFGKIEYLINDMSGKLCDVRYGHQNGAQIKNWINGSIISGVGGQSSVRSQRANLLFCDEVAFWQNPEAIMADLTSVASTVCYGSTLNQPGDVFDRRCELLNDTLFEFNWRDDPRKARKGWKEEQISKIGLDAFRVEYNMEYNESTRNPLVRHDWFKEAMNFEKKWHGIYKPDLIAGFDIAEGGGNYCSLAIRRTGEIIHLSKWREDDLKQSLRHVIDICNKNKCDTVNYDGTAMGRAVRYALDAIENEYDAMPYFTSIAMTLGVPKRRYGDCAANAQFSNGRTFWSVVFRDGIRRTFNYMKYEEQKNNHVLDTERFIWFNKGLDPGILNELLNQACGIEMLRNPSGKWQLESKKQMANRGMKSPDLLDACVLAFINHDLGNSIWG